MTGGGCWLDITPAYSDYEIGFNPYTAKYRHRLRHVSPTDDPSILIVRAISAGEWMPGPPPHYQT